MKRTILICFFLMCTFGAMYAQFSTKEVLYSWEKGSGFNTGSIPIIYMPNLDLDALYKEDLENEGSGLPYRFGFSHKVNLSLTNSGVWKTTADGGRLWSLRIYSPDAISLNLLYDQFWLPNGAKFFLYAEDMEQHIGAFTSQNNKGDQDNMKGFATEFLFTNSIVLEYYEPKGIMDIGIISICNIVSGYRNIYDNHSRTEPNPEECFLNVNCCDYLPEITNIKKGVALMIMGGYTCSGALLNTTAENYSPVFLTANHCFIDTIPTEAWMFCWEYELRCYQGQPLIKSATTSGSELLARRQETDFMLLKLLDDPATHSGIKLHYLGWDRNHPPVNTGEVRYCIHHPLALPKMISFVNRIAIYSDTIKWKDDDGNIIETSLPNIHWGIEITSGATFKGSSGSPLFNSDYRVIGQLHGGSSPISPWGCPGANYSQIDFFGRFDLSWNGSDSTTRLKDWLDPYNTNATFLDGMPGKKCTESFQNQTIDTNLVVVGCDTLPIQNVTILNDASVLFCARYEVIITPGFHASLGTDVWIRIDKPNDKVLSNISLANNHTTFSAPVLKNSSNNSITHSNSFTLSPNPNFGSFHIESNFPLSEIARLSITNLLGVSVYETQKVSSNGIQLQNAPAGIYFVVMVLKNGNVLTQKMMVQR